MPNVITALQYQKKNKERVNLFLDGKFAFGIPLSAAVKLKKGQQLSASEIDRLREEDSDQKAYDAALRYLSMRPRSTGEIEKYLTGKHVSPERIISIIAKLTELGYLNDAAFSQFWTENRQTFRPRSARALRYELRQKGLDNATIESSLQEVDEDTAAWSAVEKKLAHWRTLERSEFEKKLKGFLARRGFGFGVINKVWKQVQSEPDEQLDESEFHDE